MWTLGIYVFGFFRCYLRLLPDYKGFYGCELGGFMVLGFGHYKTTRAFYGFGLWGCMVLGFRVRLLQRVPGG